MALGEFFSQFRSLIFGGEDVLRNRRNQLRLAIDLPVTIALDKKKILPAKVCDFGSHGLRLNLGEKVSRGRRLQVQVMPDSGLEGSPSLCCRVAWCKVSGDGFQAGCSYDDKPEILATSWVQMLLIERHQRGHDRRDRRIETTLPALLIDGNSLPHSVFVLDLSLGGARVYSAQPWTAQESPRLSFAIPGQPTSVDFAVQVVESRPLDGSGFSYRLRFLDTDSKRMALLRKMLMQLLEGVRKAGRTRPKDVIAPPPPTQAQPQTSHATGPAGKLGTAVREPKQSRSKKTGVSPYLTAPELPKTRATPAPEPPGQPIFEQAPPIESLPTARLEHPGKARMQSLLLPTDSRARQRGWLSASLEGWYPRGEMSGDFLPRPTTEFLRCLGPMLPGFLGLPGMLSWHIDSDMDRGFALGPGLLWTDRRTLTLWWTARRQLMQWIEQSIRTRERLERQTSSLAQKSYQLLSLLGCGGPAAIRQILVSAQAAVGISLHRGIKDPMMLHQIRLASLLKDIGEALLFVGSQPRAIRDRYLLHLNSLEHGQPELSELSSDWSGFFCPLDLQVHRLRVEALTVEMLPCHPWLADRLLARLGFPAEIRNTIRYHHEAWGGLGYPEGLQQNEIPWAARCLAVADGFASGMTLHNHPQKAFADVANLEGTLYDATLVTSLQAYLQSVGVLT